MDISNYTDKIKAKATVVARTGIDTTELDALLAVSAGLDAAGVVVYRPYWVAWALLSDPSRIQAHQGTAFVNLTSILQNLLKIQAGLDSALGLTVPDGMSAKPVMPKPISGAIPLQVRPV
jgi:hypothetical protein